MSEKWPLLALTVNVYSTSFPLIETTLRVAAPECAIPDQHVVI